MILRIIGMLVNSGAEVTRLLGRLRAYAANKKLRINQDKTELMIYHNGRAQPDQFSEWEGQQSEVVKEFKYLGILFTCDGNNNMKKAAERMQGPFALAMAKVKLLIKREGLTSFCISYGQGKVTN